MTLQDFNTRFDSLLLTWDQEIIPTPNPSINISISEDITSGFLPIKILFSDLPYIALAKINYSPTEFKDGYRRLDNALEGNNVIVLDIDDGWTIAEAKKFLEEHNLLALITTTKSHLLPKNDQPSRDRFRIFLPVLSPFKGTTNEYRCMMQNIFKYFQDKPDKATCDMSRTFYGNANKDNHGYIFINGWKLLDLDKFERKPQRPDQEIKLIHSGDMTKLEDYWIKEAVTGNRNNTLFKAFSFYKNKLLSAGEILDKVLIINSKLADPLEEIEVRSICRS